MKIDRGLASIAVCLLGGISMYITQDHSSPSGMGMAIFGLMIIWGWF